MANKIKLGSQPGARPPAAVEFTLEGVLAAAVQSPGQEPTYAFAPLPPGALVPNIAEHNLQNAHAVSEAIRTALDEASPRTRAVTLVLPDSVVRVFVLDFDTLPAKAAEAIPVLRFRLRKMVPFDTEQAAVGYQVLSQSKDECKVLAAALPGHILAEYEAATREAGYEPGAVLPSSLAALEAIDSADPALIVNLSASTLTTAIAGGNDLQLYRTLDLPADRHQRIADVQRGIAVALAYFEDKLGSRPRVLHFAGSEDSADLPVDLANLIGDIGLEIVNLAPRPGRGAALARSSAAGVAGALAGVR